jgi:hypothetical protein
MSVRDALAVLKPNSIAFSIALRAAAQADLAPPNARPSRPSMHQHPECASRGPQIHRASRNPHLVTENTTKSIVFLAAGHRQN